MKNQRGFAALHFISFLPLMLAVGFCLYFFLSFSDSHIEMSQTCLREQIKIQESVKKSLRALFKLNPRALRLKAQYKIAFAKHVAAIASMNGAAIAATQAHLQKISTQRQLLDLQQKVIINMENAKISSDQQILKKHLSQIGERRSKDFQSFMINKIQHLQFKPRRLAIVASDKDLAPTYSLSPNSIEDQALEFTWDLNTVSQNVMAVFFSSNSRYPQNCSTTINFKEEKWPTIKHEVRSLWKPRLSYLY